jgi:hypothetical protein
MWGSKPIDGCTIVEYDSARASLQPCHKSRPLRGSQLSQRERGHNGVVRESFRGALGVWPGDNPCRATV